MIERHKIIPLTYEISANTTVSGRFYHVPGGYKYPSITTILSHLKEDAMNDWRQRVGEREANKITRQAANRGTVVHNLLEDFLEGKEINLKKQMPHNRLMFKQISKILEERVDEINSIEAPLYSDHLKTAGRVDLVGKFDGVRSIIDFKTSRKPKQKSWITSYFIQAAAYAIMYEERTGIPVPNLVIIMGVDNHKPIVFKEHRDNWTKKLKEAIKEYAKSKHLSLCERNIGVDTA